MARLSNQPPPSPATPTGLFPPSAYHERSSSSSTASVPHGFTEAPGLLALNPPDVNKSSFAAGIITTLFVYLLVQQWYLAFVKQSSSAVTFLVLGASLLSWSIGRSQGEGGRYAAEQLSGHVSQKDHGDSATSTSFLSPATTLVNSPNQQHASPQKIDGSASDIARPKSPSNELVKNQAFQPRFVPGSPSPPPSPDFDAAMAQEQARRKHEEARKSERERAHKEKERRAREKAKRQAREKEREEKELKAEREALEKIEQEQRESEQRERETREKEAMEKEKQIRKKLEKQAKELKERAARERIVRAKLEMEAREREAKEKAEREAREKAEIELRERLEREARERAELEAKEAAEREAKEKAEREAREKEEKEAERKEEIRRKMEEYKRRKEKDELERRLRAVKEAREKELKEKREKQLAAEKEAAEKAAKEQAREDAISKFTAARDALAAKRAAAIAEGRLSPSASTLSGMSGSTEADEKGGMAPPNSPWSSRIRAMSAPRSPELQPETQRSVSAEPAALELDEQKKEEVVDEPKEEPAEKPAQETTQEDQPTLPVVKVELVNDDAEAEEQSICEVSDQGRTSLGSKDEDSPVPIIEEPDNIHESYTEGDESRYSESHTGYTVEEDDDSYLDEYRQQQEDAALRSELPFTEASYTDESTYSIDRTATPQPQAQPRGGYSTLDPDKIVVAGVYLFNPKTASHPIGRLESGRGNVSDGLVLRITTEGMFIDDDVRGVAQRDWDVKAWTMALVEVWCPVLRGRLMNMDHVRSQHQAKEHKSFKLFQSHKEDEPSMLVPSFEESSNCLLQLFQTCRETCYDLNSHQTDSALGDYHVVCATVKEAEGKKYVFLLRNEEAWKVSVGLQRLRRGAQGKGVGVCGLSVDEAGETLRSIGWF